MSREVWRLIRSSKGFYVRSFRRVGSILVVSVSVNLVFGLMIFYVYLNRSDPQIYATSGAMPPEALVSMDEPNYTSSPLLADDQMPDQETKVVPQ